MVDKQSERKNEIDKNFIGIYDGYITPQMCDEVISIYEKQVKAKKTFDRATSENQSILTMADNHYFARAETLEVWWEQMKSVVVNFDLALKHYETHTGIQDLYSNIGFCYSPLKIQKTLPTQGYHVWHIEHNKGHEMEKRVLAWSIYLNDITEGGETEFLHFSKRVKAQKGRIIIWPASFPYVHRGNPPLKGEKYLLTSWMTVGGSNKSILLS